MKLLLLTTRLFEQASSGGELCTARLMSQLLAMGHELHVVGRGAAPAGEPGLRYTSLGPWVRAVDEMPPWRRAVSFAAAWWRGRAWTVHRVQADGALRRARRLLAGGALADIDILVVDHLQAWAWLEGLPGHALPPRLLLMHNLEAAGYRASDAGGGSGRRLHAWVLAREARRLAALERLAVQEAGAVACLSEEDAAQLSAASPAKAVGVLPGYFGKESLGAPAAVAARRRIGLIGTWTWPPNRRALQWVLQAVLPHLPADCELVLAGAGLAGLARLPGVRRLGRVADVQAFYAQVDVVALAALDGSGVQEKAIEALASARPVVATPLAVRGLQPLPAGIVATGDAGLFAQACAGVHGGPDAAAVQAWNSERRQRYRAVLTRLLQACAQ